MMDIVNIVKKNMKPFDIKLAKADYPIQTMAGNPARIICYNKKGGDYPIVALVEYNGKELTHYYNNNGEYEGLQNDIDLCMAPIKKEGWINIYALFGNGTIDREAEYIYPTEESAVRHKANDSPDKKYVVTKKIEWEE